MRILIADDDPLVREVAALLLDGAGLAVVEVVDGLQAVAEFEKAPFELALIDIFMPNRDGVETIRELRRRWPGTRIIAMSGGARIIRREDALEWALGLGADIVIEKPFDPLMFGATIEEQLRLGPSTKS